MIVVKAHEEGAGWCIPCDAWTLRDVEADAVARVCPSCGDRGVVGADVALAGNLIYCPDGLVEA